MIAEEVEFDITRGEARRSGGVGKKVVLGFVLAACAFKFGAFFAVDGKVAVLHDGALDRAVGYFLILPHKQHHQGGDDGSDDDANDGDGHDVNLPVQAAFRCSNPSHPCSP